MKKKYKKIAYTDTYSNIAFVRFSPAFIILHAEKAQGANAKFRPVYLFVLIIPGEGGGLLSSPSSLTRGCGRRSLSGLFFFTLAKPIIAGRNIFFRYNVNAAVTTYIFDNYKVNYIIITKWRECEKRSRVIMMCPWIDRYKSIVRTHKTRCPSRFISAYLRRF